MHRSSLAGRRIMSMRAGLAVLLSLVIVFALAPTRALWEGHGAWTHMVIVSFVGNLPNLQAEEAVPLQNQVDIGNAVKPYDGRAAGTELTKPLKEHILGAVSVLVAAKSGQQAKLARAQAPWYANGRRIAATCTPPTLGSCRARIRPLHPPHSEGGRHGLRRDDPPVPTALPLSRR